jgi:biopolymer transport protein TolR
MDASTLHRQSMMHGWAGKKQTPHWPGTPAVHQVSDPTDTRAREEQFPMAFSMAGGGSSRPQINVTPLIDVLLTLIIMFMLVVSMDPEYGEKAQIPQPTPGQTAAAPQPRTVVIQVVWTAKDQPPSVKINQEDVPWPDLESRLTRIYLTRVEKVAFVRGDADVDFQYVADVIDLAHHAGVQRVGLMTKEQKLADE